jgi:opacity protein-like surface antigen
VLKTLCAIFLFAASAALPQSLSFGLRGGVPLTDAFEVTDPSRYFSDKAPFVIGPGLEVYLPLGMSAEIDVLYRRAEYTSATTVDGQPQNVTRARTTGQIWEFPLLAKGRITRDMIFTPFVEGGFSYRRLAQFRQRVVVTGQGGAAQVTGEPQEMTGRNSVGPTIGAGLEVKVPIVRLSADVRYTRWGSSDFESAISGLASQLNQADFMLGIMF